MSFYDYSVFTPKDEEISMAKFKDKVVLVVNTATGCGFTPHYEKLEQMYEKFHEKGFEIVDVPCNQFANQTPGSDEEIHEFCQLHYNTQFAQMKKSDVNGQNELALFKFLKSKKEFAGFDKCAIKEKMEEMLSQIDPNYAQNSDIKWNFTKFIIDRNGEVVARFEPTADMEKVAKFVENLL
ncbi:MAG: glutathione peroxidase [Campylobacter sp.]|nr:glutathione peroxidase [Campylobacter sp.]